MLQSKPVRKSDTENEKDGITDIKEKIKIIQDRAHLLSGLFANMCRWEYFWFYRIFMATYVAYYIFSACLQGSVGVLPAAARVANS